MSIEKFYLIAMLSEIVLNQQEIIFDLSLMKFLEHIYDVVRPFKCYYDDMSGKLSVSPGENFYTFKKKNKK